MGTGREQGAQAEQKGLRAPWGPGAGWTGEQAGEVTAGSDGQRSELCAGKSKVLSSVGFHSREPCGGDALGLSRRQTAPQPETQTRTGAPAAFSASPWPNSQDIACCQDGGPKNGAMSLAGADVPQPQG